MIPSMEIVNRSLAFGGVLLGCLVLFCTGCGEEDVSSAAPLVSDPDAEIRVKVVQNVDATATMPDQDPVEIYNLTGGYLVALANANPRLIPISFGEPDADPARDFMLVELEIMPDFVDLIRHVELSIDIGSDGSQDWCEPMDADPIIEGGFVLQLQPSCVEDERDPLTGLCVVSGSCEGYSEGCREDLLTFTLWDDISTACHSVIGTDDQME